MSRARISFDVLMLALFIYMAYAALDFQEVARHFPLYISLAAVVLSIVNLAVNLTKLKKQGSVLAGETLETATLREAETADGDPMLAPSQALARAVRYWAWLVGFVVIISLLGITGAVIVFLTAFLALEARLRWWQICVAVVATLLVLGAFRNIMNLRWPASLIDVGDYLPLMT